MNDLKTLLIDYYEGIFKPLGFKKKQNSFYLNHENIIGVISFQKSRDSSALVTKFTINLGVYSKSLNMFDISNNSKFPLISDCHWRKRIGFLLPQKSDFWWELYTDDSYLELKTELEDILKNIAIPKVKKLMSDESLMELWLNGNSDGLTTQQMSVFLIALLKKYDISKLDLKIKELIAYSKGKPFQENVKEDLRKIGIKYVE